MTSFLSTRLAAQDLNASYDVLQSWQSDNTSLRPTTFADGIVYVAGDVSLEAWDVKTGRRVWSHKLDKGADFRPRIAGHLVLALGRSYITALDRKTGHVAWSMKPERTPGLRFDPVGAPFVHNNHIYLGIGPFMTALDLSGEVVWSHPTEEKKGIWYAPTTYDDDTVLFGPGDGKLYAMDTDTGATKWVTDNAKKWQYLRQLHVSANTIVAGGYKDNLFGVDAQTGKVVWDWYSGNFINSHLVYGDATYLWSPTGWVYALNAHSGEINWRAKSDYFPKASGKRRPWAPVMAELVANDAGVYVLDMKNVLHVLDHQSGTETAAISFEDRLRPFVTLTDVPDEMFLGTNTGKILHVKLKNSKP
ncbi:PQQ-binding-like beta-propeller repeat protein [Magnetovibrio sp. PR-2]|uniref:outer membrane protein assembly factor BamB family protein n=1 Tax=Magnetovibrio sp. PR-2 TaxID=3120356 RepID=UPI002FCE2140